MRLARGCVLLAACGRFDFDALPRQVDAAADVRTVDVPVDGANLCLPSYRICDGFEGALAANWSQDIGSSIDTQVAHRGTSSVHFHSAALATSQQGYYRISDANVLSFADSPLYVRAFFRFGSLPAASNAMELVAADQVGGTNFGDFLFVKTSSFLVYEQWDDQSNAAPTTPPLNTWICALWTVVRDTGTAGSITLDGDLGTTSIANVTTDGSPPVSVFSFGVGYAATNVLAAQPAMDVWMDDLIVAPVPLTCAD